MDYKVTIGCELPKERWTDAAKNISQVAPAIAKRLQIINHEGKGKQDAEDFMNDIMLACIALKYVAKCATDKCRFIPIGEQLKSFRTAVTELPVSPKPEA